MKARKNRRRETPKSPRKSRAFSQELFMDRRNINKEYEMQLVMYVVSCLGAKGTVVSTFNFNA